MAAAARLMNGLCACYVPPPSLRATVAHRLRTKIGGALTAHTTNPDASPSETGTSISSDIDYRSLIESLDEGFCICEMIVDRHGRAVDYRFLEVNASFSELTGFQPDAVGKTALQLVPGLEGYWLEAYARVALAGETLRFENHSEAMGQTFDVWATPFGPKGSGRFAVVFRDVTAKKQTEDALRQSQARLSQELASTRQLQEISTRLLGEETAEALFEQILDAAVAIMRSQYASIQMLYPDRGPGGELLLLGFRGFNPEAAKFWEWVRPASESTCGVALRTGERCVVSDVEACEWMAGTADQATYLDTGIHAVQTTPLTSRTGKLLGMISTHWQDPHEPAEHELRLLDVLARQAADLIERTRTETELRRSAQLKDELLGMVSHEFRTPLTTIAGNIDILTRRMAELPPDELTRLLDELRADSGRLQRLVENMLIIARSNGLSQVDAEPLLLQHVLPAILDRHQRPDEPGGITLAAPPDLPPVLGVPGYVEQVLENLLTNAGKYGRAGGEIGVTAECQDRHVVVRVADQGDTLDPEEVRQFLEPFYRSGNHARRVSGAGLGLAVCVRLVESMGGTISAQPNPGGGLEVAFTLPLAEA